MIETQLVRRSEDLFVTLTPPRTQVRAEQLREHFTAEEARLFGIDSSYDRAEAGAFARNSLIGAFAAVATTATLFLTVGFLATLGLPELGHAFATVPANVA